MFNSRCQSEISQVQLNTILCLNKFRVPIFFIDLCAQHLVEIIKQKAKTIPVTEGFFSKKNIKNQVDTSKNPIIPNM